MFKTLMIAVCVMASSGLKVMFENFEQLSGFDEALFNLRTRKYNRSTTVLNGTIVIPSWVGNEVVFSLDLFHSRLGNQQFNHYPMKLPTTGCCSFIDNLHLNYGKYLENITNTPGAGECPFSPRTIHFSDFALPSEVVPSVMPRGLWKAYIVGKRHGTIIVAYSILVKGYDDF